jgi:ABC-2 type transport system permease protein
MILNQIAAIGIKELKVLWHDRPALALLFLMPVFFILVMSYALQTVFEAGSKGRPIPLLVVNDDAGHLADRAVAEMKRLEGITVIEKAGETRLTPASAERLVSENTYPLALVFTRDFSGRVLREGKAGVQLFVDPATNQQLVAPVRGALQGIMERLVLSERITKEVGRAVADLRRTTPGPMPIPEEAGRELEAMLASRLTADKEGSAVVLETVFPGGTRAMRRPTATEQNVPAYTIFGVFFITLTLASSFIRERTDGTLVRLLAAPLSRGALLAGKLLPYYVVNLVQIALMFAVGVVVFDMKPGNIPALALISLSLALAANGLGLLIAAIGRTEAQVGALAVLCSITLAALGGLMVPAFVMPETMRSLALLTPQAWALAGYHDVILRGLGLRSVLPEAGMLLAYSALFFGTALWRFRL